MLRNWLSRFTASVAIMLFTGGAMAAPVSGTVVWSGHFAESAVSSDLSFGGGLPFSNQEVLLLCVDVHTKAPDDGPVAFISNAGASTLKGGSGELGTAAINWILDQYYETYFKNGSDKQQWAFQYAVWEIGNDFNGNVSSIDISAGASKPLVDGYFAGDPVFVAAYEAMYSGMTAAIPNLSPSYKSTKYTVDFFANADEAQQDMVAIIEKAPPVIPPTTATPVPTLSQWSLIALSAVLAIFGLMIARKRQA